MPSIGILAVRFGWLAMLASLGACALGPRAERHSLARGPSGASVTLETTGGSMRGELLAVQDSALLVLAGTERLTLVPYRAIRRADAELARQITLRGRMPSAGERERLRRVSRYPQGVTPELLRALLAAYGQAEPEVVRP